VKKRPEPLFLPLDGLRVVQRRFTWLVGFFFAWYLCSGISKIGPEEVGLIVRMGKLRGESYEERVHLPGLIFALPYPFERVIRVPVKREFEEDISTFRTTAQKEDLPLDSLDPQSDGYVLTGDLGVFRIRLSAKYRIQDPIAFSFAYEDPKALVFNAVSASVMRVCAAHNSDDVLRVRSTRGTRENHVIENMGELLQREAQKTLDRMGSGIQLTMVDLQEVSPPSSILPEFTALQTARVQKETAMQAALAERASAFPTAQSEKARMILDARVFASGVASAAHSETSTFAGILPQYLSNPKLTKVRLRAEALEEILQKSEKKYIVPSFSGGNSIRLMLSGRGGN
jgi:membrane protease subunit HflK